MTSEDMARVTRRWRSPEYDADGKHWTARLQERLTPREQCGGLESAVYGPDACARETHRQDRLWAEFPLYAGDLKAARERLRFLAGGPGGDVT
ncbi:hypothetical protein [Actinomadura terrae]|uniref:hypothetical protein n=1 Tax=Actinomadura terrae TaxID=604353 RepID=UPI001FA6B239|nr:hypothetical protein [Actinomadura terrae]